jgi:TorA maturation chaperone TorD
MSGLYNNLLRAPAPPIDEMEKARAGLYRLLGATLSHPPTPKLIEALRRLPIRHDDSPIGAALARLARAARSTALESARRQYDVLFVGIARGELLPYASFYLTGFLHDRPLARLREELARLGLAATPGHPDPEDHAGTLCEVMAGLIDGEHGAPNRLDVQRHFFRRHMATWIGQFFADLEAVTNAGLYSAAGGLGRAFFDVESHAFEMEA